MKSSARELNQRRNSQKETCLLNKCQKARIPLKAAVAFVQDVKHFSVIKRGVKAGFVASTPQISDALVDIISHDMAVHIIDFFDHSGLRHRTHEDFNGCIRLAISVETQRYTKLDNEICRSFAEDILPYVCKEIDEAVWKMSKAKKQDNGKGEVKSAGGKQDESMPAA